MSHYAVLALTHDEPTYEELRRLLQPYDENLAVEDATDESGESYTWNPDGRWDWWEVGGRFAQSLLLKDGSWETCAPVSALETEQTEAMREALEEEWARLSSHGDGLLSSQYFVEAYGDMRTYVESHRPNTFLAVVDDDGWHEGGRMGWFGIFDESPGRWRECQAVLRDAAMDGKWATVVDCHV